MNWKKAWTKKWETQSVLMLLKIVIWSIFIGLCIQSGTLLFTFVYSIFKPTVAQDLYQGLNLYGLLESHRGHYVSSISFILFILGSKAYIFFLMIQVFRKLNMVQPFSREISQLISKIGEVTIQIGLTLILAAGYFKWLLARGFNLDGATQFSDGAVEFLTMGAVIYALAQVFKRGVEIQSENELTV